MSAMALVGTVLFGVACAYVISRLHFQGKTVLHILAMLPWV